MISDSKTTVLLSSGSLTNHTGSWEKGDSDSKWHRNLWEGDSPH